MVNIPAGPAAVFLTILIGYFVMTVWFAQARRQNLNRKPDLSPGENPAPSTARKAG